MLDLDEIVTTLTAYSNLHTKNATFAMLIDFTRPADRHRLFVVNVKTGGIVYQGYTSHGKNSGARNGKKLTFSNIPESKKSSKGLMKTGDTYIGKYGYSLRLHGIQKGINDNVLRRAIVIHPAPYAADSYVRKHKYPGRSWGCITLDPEVSEQMIDLLKNGSVVYVHA